LRLCVFAFNNFSSRLSRNTLTLLVSNGGGALLSFVLSVIIGRALGEEGLGIYAAALAWVFPLWILAEFGLDTLITREVAQTPDSAPAYLHAASLARLALGGGLMIAFVLIAPLLTDNPLLVRGLQISAPLIVIGPFVSVFTATFRARQIMWPIAALNIGMLIAQVALTVWALARGGDVLLALAINTATSAGQLAAAWGIYRTKFNVTSVQDKKFFPQTPHPPTPSPLDGEGELSAAQRGEVKTTPLSRTQVNVQPVGTQRAASAFIQTWTLLRRAWPFALAAVLAALQIRLSLILLERMTSAAEVGQYAAASRFVEAGRMLPNALFGALFPALSALSSDPAALNRVFQRAMLGLTAYGIVFGIGALLLAGWLIHLTYGAQFDQAVFVLIFLAWALLPGLLKSGRVLYCYALGQEDYVNRVMAVTLVIQFALGLWLIDRHGAAGAALALIVTECVALILLWRRT
jgi:O-antigen/teichoic acid export membrane protein